MSDACTYCGSDVSVHDPVFVAKLVDGQREQTGQFCTYACLSAYIGESELTTGDCCRIEYG